VAVAAHDRFADLVRENGLEHRELPGDPVELTRARRPLPLSRRHNRSSRSSSTSWARV
jgi:hypothetical protein